MKRYSAIDIGTNSIRILIAEVEKYQIKTGYKALETTRIGEGVDRTGQLSEAAIERSLETLRNFVGLAREKGIEEIPVIATSAVRDASNRQIFLDRAKTEIGIDIQVITGQEEAELGFLGVLKGLKDEDQNILVVDIGGGSTELIYGSSSGIVDLVSLNMGAVRMTEKYIHTDPVDETELSRLKDDLDQMMEPVIRRLKTFSIDQVIGIGGTATTLASICKGLEVYDRDQVHQSDLSHDQIREMLGNLAESTLEERKKIPGLHPKRADVITAGAMIMDRILTLLNKSSVRVSEYDNLEGLIFKQIASFSEVPKSTK